MREFLIAVAALVVALADYAQAELRYRAVRLWHARPAALRGANLDLTAGWSGFACGLLGVALAARGYVRASAVAALLATALGVLGCLGAWLHLRAARRTLAAAEREYRRAVADFAALHDVPGADPTARPAPGHHGQKEGSGSRRWRRRRRPGPS